MTDNGNLALLLTNRWIEAQTFEAFLDYSTKNVDRMRELYEKVQIPNDLSEQVSGFEKEARVLVIGADWCGDVVANLPAMARLAELNPKIELRVIDRDRHEDLINEFLTGGSKSIPKAIVAPSSMAHCKSWGPRPAECQAIMNENKGKMPKEEIYPKIRDWYANDKSQSVLKDLWALIAEEAEIP